MIPDGVFWESLGLFFAKDFAMLGVFFQDFSFVYFLGGPYCRFTEQDSFGLDGSRFVNGS